MFNEMKKKSTLRVKNDSHEFYLKNLMDNLQTNILLIHELIKSLQPRFDQVLRLRKLPDKPR
jgi:hypothetical protein